MKNFLDDADRLQGHTKKPLLKIIREKCLDCCVHKPSEVRLCSIKTCPLWPYRMGKNPFHLRKMTDKQKHAAAQRLKRETKNSYEADVANKSSLHAPSLSQEHNHAQQEN